MACAFSVWKMKTLLKLRAFPEESFGNFLRLLSEIPGHAQALSVEGLSLKHWN